MRISKFINKKVAIVLLAATSFIQVPISCSDNNLEDTKNLGAFDMEGY